VESGDKIYQALKQGHNPLTGWETYVRFMLSIRRVPWAFQFHSNAGHKPFHCTLQKLSLFLFLLHKQIWNPHCRGLHLRNSTMVNQCGLHSKSFDKNRWSTHLYTDSFTGPQCSDFWTPQELEEEHEKNLRCSLELFVSIANFGSQRVIAVAARGEFLKNVESGYRDLPSTEPRTQSIDWMGNVRSFYVIDSSCAMGI
jgi:hypothetical protein